MIWLVIPGAREGERGAGQWKDLQGIRLVLDRLGTGWREFNFNGSNLDELTARIGGGNDTVIWYYTFWPEALEALRHRCPGVRIVLRTVNAEALQHWLRAGKDWRRLHGLPRDVYGLLRLWWRDRRCARAADVLAGISPWDDEHYWARLAGRTPVRHVPYLCPWPALLPQMHPPPWAQRENTIICLAGTRDVIGRAHVAGFAALARRPELAAWRFAASAGLLDAAPDPLPAGVERLGRIAEPWERLCRVKAVALLSPWGYGYKTTAADALAAGCHVLVHPRQHVRLPRAEQARCLPVDPAAPADVRRAAASLSRAPESDAAREFPRQCEMAAAAWKDILDRGGSRRQPEVSHVEP